MLTRVEELLNVIKTAEEELKTIRVGCMHTSYHVGYWSWRIGSMQVARVCTDCWYFAGVPSKEEVTEFQKTNKLIGSPTGVELGRHVIYNEEAGEG